MRAGGTAISGDECHSVTQLNEEAFLGRKSPCKIHERGAYGAGRRADRADGVGYRQSPLTSISLEEYPSLRCRLGSPASKEP